MNRVHTSLFFLNTHKNLLLAISLVSIVSTNPLVAKSITPHAQVAAQTEWTVLVYVQANNNLSSFAHKNFNDMAMIGSNENVSMLVQWYQPGQHGVWRYKIQKGKMVLDECHAIETDGNSSKDLSDAMRWAVTKYPAKKYSLVLWNHGIGIVDPVWGKQRFWNSKFDPAMIASNPRMHIEGITHTTANHLLADNSGESAFTHRGILFNEHAKTYMNNASLVHALHDIKTNVLKNKKLDLFGMDACLMSMVEIGYLAHKYAHIMVSSQDVELAHGWDYLAITQRLAEKNISAEQMAQSIVGSYEKYYKDKIHFYTQSAVKLDLMPSLKESINAVVLAFRACQLTNKDALVQAARKARRGSLQFSSPNYIDLHSFYHELNKEVHTINCPRVRSSQALSILKVALGASMQQLEDCVLINTVGKNVARAKGLSIYFPHGGIDASYPKNEFAKECLWYEFIKELCAA